MRLKRFICASVSALVAVCSLPSVAVLADDGYATRGEVLQALMTAADDYNPNVRESDIMHGDENGLREDEPVTRAEALIMLGRAFGGFPELTGNNLRLAIPREDFTDIPEWAEAELDPVFDAGIVAGTGEGTFSPDRNVTTEEMRTFINRVFTLYGSNPKDSFYSSVNKAELDSLQIEDGLAENGTIAQVIENTSKQVKEIITEAAEGTPESGSPQEKIKVLYDNIMDMDARNAAGYEPIRDDLEAVGAAQSIADLNEISVLEDSRSAVSTLISFSPTIDPMDSSSYMSSFSVASPSLNKQVYDGEVEYQKAAYLKYITTLLTLCGEDRAKAEADANEYFEFEKRISDASLTVAEQYDIENTYNIYTLEELKALFPSCDLDALYEEAGLIDQDEILVRDVGQMEAVASLISDDNIESVKNYIKISLIGSCASMFGEDFIDAGNTYQQEMMGTTGTTSLEDDASSIVSNVLADYVGQAYAERYCTDEIVNDVTDMIDDVIEVYRERISELDWMSDTTKEKALLKLDTMMVNVGAPDYDDYEFTLETADLKSADEGGSYYQNMIEISKANMDYMAELAGTEIDRTQWITNPQTVNAFYMSAFNSINFPAAFLQEPVYDIDGSYEERLGTVGFVIGHEITHAFDSSGSQYDENGNAVNWWTEEDAAAFDSLCQDVVEYYEGLESAPGIVIDSEQTLTENIADLGGMSCITEIGSKYEDFDFKAMYESYSTLWLSVTTREYAQALINMDVHSPNNVRTDRVLQSVDKFYEVYDIQPGDGMYVAPEDRARIW